jgi:hypothetical protein
MTRDIQMCPLRVFLHENPNQVDKQWQQTSYLHGHSERAPTSGHPVDGAGIQWTCFDDN